MAYAFSEEELTFTACDNDLVYRRKLFGTEAETAYLSQIGELNVTAGISLVFPMPITQEDARKYIETAWIRLRHAIPAIALTCHVASQDAQTFSFQYAVPSSATVKDWVQQTMFWMDDKSSLRDRQSFIIENHIWDGTSGEYMTRLYIGKSSDSDREYDLMIYTTHANADGRGIVQIFDRLVQCLDEIVRPNDTFVSAPLIWGDEVTRLAPSAALLAIRLVDAPVSTLSAPRKSSDVPTPRLFLSPMALATGNTGTLAHFVTLSTTETSALRAACRLRKCTVTAILVAAVTLAEMEHQFRSALLFGEAETKAFLEQFEDADMYPLFNIHDSRKYLGTHSSHNGPAGSPSLSISRHNSLMPMDLVRSALQLDGDNMSMTRSEPGFWRLAEYANTQIQTAGAGLRGYISRECHIYAAFLGNEGALPGTQSNVMSSIGDLELLGNSERWQADSLVLDEERIRIQDFNLNGRLTSAVKSHISWQFKGRLTIGVGIGAGWSSSEDFGRYGGLLMHWIGCAYIT